MAHRLTPEAAAAWLNRFSAFGDAVIRSLTVQEQATGAGREAIVRLDAQDNDAEGTWARVTLTVQDVDEFRLIQGPGDFMVIFELQVDCRDETVDVSQEDGSWFIRGSRLWWTVEPLAEC